MDDIPLVKTKKPNVGDYIRSGSCTGDPKQNALACLKNTDLTVFTDVVADAGADAEARGDFPLPDDHWINQSLPEEDDRTLLILAIERGLHDFTDVLLRAGANAMLYSNDLGRCPVHVACEERDATALKLLFRHARNCADVNAVVQEDGSTALHIACSPENGDEACFDALLSVDGVDVNAADDRGGQTPLYLAAMRKSERMVMVLLENGADQEAKCFSKTCREHIKVNLPNFDPDEVKVKKKPDRTANKGLKRMVDLLSLNRDLADRYQDEFHQLLLNLDDDCLNGQNFGQYTLLQALADRSFVDCARALLENKKGVEVDGVTATAPMTPLLVAAHRGDADMMRLLIEHKANLQATTGENKENVLHILLKHGGGKDGVKYQACVEYLLGGEDDLKSQLRVIVNRRDVLQNTPLHYATQLWPQETVRMLLEVGGNIGMKNHWDEIPISKISPQTMEDFLDEFCIQAKGDVNHENFEITFNYSFLAPPVEDLPYENREGINSIDPEHQKLNSDDNSPRVALPETQSLWYMGQSKEHRHLLKHPVVTSFLYLKWGRIRKDFNRNLRFYLLFVFMLTWYVFEKFGGVKIKPKDPDSTIPLFHGLFGILCAIMVCFIFRDWFMDIKEKMKAEKLKEIQNEETLSSGKMFCLVLLTNWIEAAFLAFLMFILAGGQNLQVLEISLVALTCLLVIREFFQVTVSLKRYMLSPENWLEITVIVLILIILFHGGDKDNVSLKRHLSAVAIVFSWAELITLVGKHPKLTRYNVYVVMFYKVMGTFFFFLCWYAFFIIAFGLGFYLMLHKDGPDDEPPGQDDYIFFNSPWLALVKASTMFVGELEFGDIPIDTESSLAPFSYIFFLAFVFLIVVVLMNLLNGLAVSDTGLIQEKAEIFSYISRVETISYTESILLGDPFNFLSNWPALKWLKDVPSCSFCSHLYRKKSIRRLFHKLTGVTGLLLFYNVLPTKKLTLTPNCLRKPCRLCHVKIMDESIVSSAKDVVLKVRSRDAESASLDGAIRTMEARMEERISRMESKIDALVASMAR